MNISDPDPFQTAFAELATMLSAACGVELLWKDVNPSRWSAWRKSLCQHQGVYCQAIKSDPQRLSCCITADTAEPGSEIPAQRTCPFGVDEMVVPVRRGGELLGWCVVSGWRQAAPDSVPSGLTAVWEQLPLWQEQPAKAIAEVVRRLVNGLIHLRPGGLPVEDARLRRCDALIEEQLDATLRGHHLASQLSLSPSRFVHWFKEVSGETITQHLQRRLMAKACKMLLGSDYTVTRVAMDLGYSSSTVFATAFKRYHGTSPGHWRRHMHLAGE